MFGTIPQSHSALEYWAIFGKDSKDGLEEVKIGLKESYAKGILLIICKRNHINPMQKES